MTPLDDVFDKVSTPKQFAFAYMSILSDGLASVNYGQIENLIKFLKRARERGAHLYFIGNGGKATLCDEWVNDLSVALPDKPFKAHSIMSRTASLTAASNDYENGYTSALSRIMEPLVSSNDVVIALSGSGESLNIIHAVEWANEVGAQTIVIGRGGQVSSISDLFLKIPVEDDGPTEDMTMAVLHVIHAWFKREDALYPHGEKV